MKKVVQRGRKNLVFLSATLIVAIVTVWCLVGLTPLLPARNPITNGVYLVGRVAGYAVANDAPYLIYPGHLPGPAPVPIQADIHRDCQIHYLPFQSINSARFANVTCEDVRDSGVRSESFLIRLVEKPSSPVAYAVGFNRSVVARNWRRSLKKP